MEPDHAKLPRIGVFSRDPLRIEGMLALLGDPVACQVTVLLSPRAKDLVALDLVIIDAAATAQLLSLIAVFLRISSTARLLILGTSDEGSAEELELMAQVLEAGARGFLSRSFTSGDLALAVKVMLDGSMWAPRKVISQMLERARSRAVDGQVTRPSRREIDVLRLLVKGRSNREIAGVLRINEGTVKSHLSRLMRKAGVKNRTELTMNPVSAEWLATVKTVPKRE